LNYKQEAHPSTKKFSEVQGKDYGFDKALCQKSFQYHKCSKFCMRPRKQTKKKETMEERKRMVCRCGAGLEKTPGLCDTPGFFERERPALVRDIRGFDRVDMPRNTRRITQCSSYLARGWRGNCDIQYLIYTSDPDKVDASDISRVTNYVVSYACKGNETQIEEKKAMSQIVMAAEEEKGDERDVKKLARKMLNLCSKNQIVSKQEASCQMAGLDMYLCSESIYSVSLAGETRLGSESEAKSTFLVHYAKRGDELHHMSLNAFFHHWHNRHGKFTEKTKMKIPMFTGAQSEAVYPATPENANAVLMIHCPWKTKFHLKKDDENLLSLFKEFITDPTRCPDSVSVAYERAKLLKSMKEPVSKGGDIDYSTYSVEPDQDIKDIVALAGSIFHANGGVDPDSGLNFDYGKDLDWSQQSIKVCTASNLYDLPHSFTRFPGYPSCIFATLCCEIALY
jgi:hypothetical protein